MYLEYFWFYGNVLAICLWTGYWLYRNKKMHSKWVASEFSDRIFFWVIYVWMFSILGSYFLIVYLIACLILVLEISKLKKSGELRSYALPFALVYITSSAIYVMTVHEVLGALN